MNTASKLLTFSAIAALGSSSFLAPNENPSSQLPSGLHMINGKFDFGCTINGTSYQNYLPSSYLTVKADNLSWLCNQLQDGQTYRLQGGDVVEKTSGECHIKENFTGVPDHLACGRWEEGTYHNTDAKTCPENYTLLESGNVGQLRLWACPKIPQQGLQTAHKGLFKKYIKSGKVTCIEHPERASGSEELACVSPTFTKLTIASNDNEKVCGEGQSLITYQEFTDNKQTLCNFLGKELKVGIKDVRLAGGALVQVSVFGDNLKCELFPQKGYSLVTKALCADIKRTSA